MPLALKIYAGIAYGCYQWFCIVAVLGFARRWLNRDSAARRYLTDAVFPYYIVHQTAIILIAHALINIFSSPLVALFTQISVWWHVIGVLVIIVLLVAVPTLLLATTA